MKCLLNINLSGLLDLQQLVVARVETKQGEMAFSRYAAHCWNQLPMGIRSAPTLTCFKKKLKTALFSTAFN